MFKLRQAFNFKKPRRAASLLVGGSIVAASMSLMSAGESSSAEDETPPEAAMACVEDQEVLRLSRHLRQRHDTLSADFMALEREQKELQTQRDSLDVRLEELRSLRREVTVRIARWQSREERERAERLRQLIGIIGEMKPARAAGLLAESKPALAADVLMQLEEQQAGRILELMPPPKAATLARRLATSRIQAAKDDDKAAKPAMEEDKP